jgi:hypothetical protein
MNARHTYQHPAEAVKLRSEIRDLEIKVAGMRKVVNKRTRQLRAKKAQEKALIDAELRKCMGGET